MRIYMNLSWVMLSSLLLGCSANNHKVDLTGSNKFADSQCKNCRKLQPFYKNGQWLIARK